LTANTFLTSEQDGIIRRSELSVIFLVLRFMTDHTLL